jgi:hypothetical protein
VHCPSHPRPPSLFPSIHAGSTHRSCSLHAKWLSTPFQPPFVDTRKTFFRPESVTRLLRPRVASTKATRSASMV